MRAVLAQQQRPRRPGAAPAPAGPDPWQWWDARTIAAAAQVRDITSVERNWPLVFAALARLGIADRATCMAAIGTIAVETAHTFEPVREAFWLSEAWRQANLRYWPYYGRGLVQLTWLDNYRTYGDAIGIDLVNNPDRAMEPEIAADNLARYFATHGGGALIPAAARAGNLAEVRRLVQGGDAGLSELVATVTALQAA